MKARVIFALLTLCAIAQGAPPAFDKVPSLDEAIALFQAKSFPAARSALEVIVKTDPHNAAACFYLGCTLERRGDAHALDEAVPWLERATQLDPNNATYLAEFGGASMELAQKNTSLTAATRGREAMEKAVRLDPTNLDARQGLFEFYEQAPWPLGSSEKAAAQLSEIRKHDPIRAIALSVRMKTDVKDYAGAFRICDALLAKNPDDYIALYQYGRTAALSGDRLVRGVECLKKCLALPPPGPAAPKPTNVWNRLGDLELKLGRTSDARTAYATALQLDPANRQATDALAKLK
jgi:tetratricopeptide (TPR) repeat protein